jgi:hypothetical protein
LQGWLIVAMLGREVKHRIVQLTGDELVKATDLSRVDAAFSPTNGHVSMLFFVFWAADALWKS